MGVILPMQGTQVQLLVWEDCTCHRATKPTCCNSWAHMLQLLKPVNVEPVLPNKRSHHEEQPMYCNWRAAPFLHN